MCKLSEKLFPATQSLLFIIPGIALSGCARAQSANPREVADAGAWQMNQAFLVVMGGSLLVLLLALVWALLMRRQAQLSTAALQKELEEHHRTEAALRANESKLRAIYESASNVALVVVDILNEACPIIEFSPGAEKLFGYTADEIIGKPVAVLNFPDDAPFYQEIIALTRAGQSGYQGEMMQVHKSGKLIPTLLSINPYFNSQGSVVGALSVSMDISERKQMEDALRRSEEMFKKVFRLSPDALSITQIPEGKFLDVNQSFMRLTGYSVEETLGKTTRELGLWPSEVDRQRFIEKIEQKNEITDFETEMYAKDGSIHQANVSAAFIELGEKICALTITRDITERKQQEARIERQVAYLSALRAIDTAITSNLDLPGTLKIIHERATALLKPDACSIMLLNGDDHTLSTAISSGFQSDVFFQRRMGLGEGMAGSAAQSKSLLAVMDADAMAFAGVSKRDVDLEGFQAYFAEPLVAKGEVKGVLEMFFRREFEPPAEWRSFLQTLAGQAAIVLEHSELLADLQQAFAEMNLAYNETIEGWARALEMRDGETKGHSVRVMELTTTLASRLGVSGNALMDVRRGALLHDIGKMGIPDSILLKNDLLTPDEWDIMRKHPLYSYQLLSGIDFLRAALDIPYSHHERWDGSGYPNGLKGEEIPLSARVFAVVDVYDALSSDRPYRKAWPAERIRSFMETQSGKHFDPKVLELFLTWLDEQETLKAS